MAMQPPQTPPGGWPKGAAGKELQQALMSGEQVLGWVEGRYSNYLVATDRRALIIIIGGATGQFFGRKVNSFPYTQLTSVDLRTGIFNGYVELGAGGVQSRRLGGNIDQMTADNVCPFNKGQEKAFRQLTDILRQRIHAAQQAQVNMAPMASAPAGPSIPEQIEQLAKLRDAGILSPDEFEAKKAELLARM